jgi:2-desacetyl-2-hydroxyethyl bacteriochlorophyllide A dehydrogenase
MTELLALPVRNLLKSEGLSADACAVIEFLAIGAHAVRRGVPGSGDSVLVVGAGPIGLGAALFARLAGADVQLADTDEERAAQVAGIAGVEPARAGGTEDFDVVFDATGSRAAMEDSFDRVAPGGTCVMVGVVKDRIAFSDPDFHRKEMTLMASRNATTADFARVMEAVRAGDVDVGKMITHRTSLPGAVRDLPVWARDKAGLIKAVIEIA